MIEQGEINRMFVVDMDAGRMFWRDGPRTHPRLKGVEAGSIRTQHSGKLYWIIKIDGKTYKRSHLIFLLANGYWPTPCVDHINGNSTDDRPSNLRQATIQQNAWNHKKRKRRASLPMGVRSLPSGRYEARIGHNGRQVHLGSYETPAAAQAVYLDKRRELYGEFA